MIDEKRLAQMMADQYNEYWNRGDIFEAIETQMAMRVMLTIHNMIDSLAKADVTDTNAGCKWIPCSERMPKYGQYVLVTIESASGEKFVRYERIRDGKWWLFETESVKAWMPLPEPYREDGV